MLLLASSVVVTSILCAQFTFKEYAVAPATFNISVVRTHEIPIL